MTRHSPLSLAILLSVSAFPPSFITERQSKVFSELFHKRLERTIEPYGRNIVTTVVVVVVIVNFVIIVYG